MDNKVNDQAEQLKRIFAEVEQHEANSGVIPKKESTEEKKELNPSIPKMDVLNLPPRREVHSNEKNRARLKIGRPFLRLIFVTVLLLILVIGTYVFFGEELIAIIKQI